MLHVMGYQVYDCDSRAKQLMISDENVRRQLIAEFGTDTYSADGTLNRQHLSTVAFGNDEALARLNAIVHPATANDILRWAKEQALQGASVAFVETAILRTSGLDRLVDEVWHVTAPTEVRIGRVMARSGLSEQQVLDRMEVQQNEEAVAPGEQVIINDNAMALIPQVTKLLGSLAVSQRN